jgi:D-serine deaminase-like pyridoxal phosphate-dependent protein
MKPHLEASMQALGQPGSRRLIPTPAAVLDLDAFERNLAKMAGRAQAARLALRPHAKSHKCAALARRQIEAGAVGICCAKLAEAEALAMEGIGAILVTSPIVGAGPAARAAALAADVADFRFVLDHPDGAAELAAAAEGLVQVLIDVDPGLGRTGVHGGEKAVELYRAIAAQPQLKFLGVQCYGGNWQHIEGANARAAAVADGMAKLKGVLAALRDAGADVGVVTGGGTGSFAADAAQGVLNEVQPGSYAFMDRDYRNALKDDPDGEFEQALAIETTVISANHAQWVTVDGGLKAFATDGPLPLALTPKFEGSAYRFFGDEHGLLMRPQAPVARGERVAFMPPHIDPTLDRYDVLFLVRGDAIVEIAPVEARGASQ